MRNALVHSQIDHTPVSKLHDQDWMNSTETLKVISALSASGTKVRFVGGCIRDALSKRKVEDIDIGTPDPPETVLNLLKAHKIKAVPTGISHGTITALINNKKFEITTLRRDVKTDGRHANVSFSEDWIIDAKRRDFTINALSATPKGLVYDPFQGITDLKNGKVTFIGHPEDRINEDYLRIIRYYRFNGIFSKRFSKNQSREACRKAAPHLVALSKERIRDELFKILLIDNPAKIIQIMKDDGILEIILPEAKNIKQLNTLNKIQTQILKTKYVRLEPVLSLAALTNVDLEETISMTRRLRLSKIQSHHFRKLSLSETRINPDMGEISELKFFQHAEADFILSLILLAWSKELCRNVKISSDRARKWSSFLERSRKFLKINFPITGKDVMDLGITSGPLVGLILMAVEGWWKNDGLTANRQECLNRLKKEIEIRNKSAKHLEVL